MLRNLLILANIIYLVAIGAGLYMGDTYLVVVALGSAGISNALWLWVEDGMKIS